MPRQDIARYEIHLSCDFCGESVHFDTSTPDSTLTEKMSQWVACFDAINPPTQGHDTNRWYDSLSCLNTGEARNREQLKKKMDEEKALAKINETLKNSGMMEKALKLVEA